MRTRSVSAEVEAGARRRETPPVPWSLNLGRFAGIDVYVHATFLLLLAWIALVSWTETRSPAAVAAGLVLVLLLFLCVVLHEYGHALTARRYGIGTKHITLLPIGGVAQLESMPRDPWQEIVVALAGPAVNVVIAAVLYLVLLATGRPEASFALQFDPGGLLRTLFAANVMLVLFNLLPAFPMDGGRVLRALLALRMDRVRATNTAARVGQTLAIGFGLLGLLGNPFLVLIAVFVWIGAGAEAAAVEADTRLARQTAGRAMITTFAVLAPSDPLSEAVDLTLSGTQKDFPVLDGERIAGVLTQAAILHGLSEHGPSGHVGRVMLPAQTADVATPLSTLLQTVQSSKTRLVLITRAGRLAGVVDLENIAEYLRIQQALGRR